MESERDQIRKQLRNLISKSYKPLPCKYAGKSVELADKARLEGDKLYQASNHGAKDHQAIINLYSESVAAAPFNSKELASAYANRSVVLYHMNRFRDCLKDIDRAFPLSDSNPLKVKLCCRKVQCLAAIGLPGGKSAFKEAMKYFNMIDKKDRRELDDDIDEARKQMKIKEPRCREFDNKELKEVLAKREEEDIFDFVEIEYSAEQGRYLVAKKDFMPGDIIFIEKPYAVFPNDKELPFLYCCHCLALTLAGIPCDVCSWCLFCSEECKKEAWKKYHDQECSIMPHIVEPQSSSMCLKLAVRILIMMIKEAGGLDKLREELQNIDVDTDSNVTCYATTEFDNLIKLIYTLSSNISESVLSDILPDLAKNLFSIIQFPPFFGQRDLTGLKPADLAKSKNFLFIGGLLLKLIKINCSNKFLVKNFLFKSDEICVSNLRIHADVEQHYTNLKGISLQLIGSFFNNSCSNTANAEKFYTEDSKVVIYAIEPIEKNSQIFIDYLCIYHQFYNHAKVKYELTHQYGFNCQCVVCEKAESNVPPVEASFTGNSINSGLTLNSYMLRCLMEKTYNPESMKNIRDKIKNDIVEACKTYGKTSPDLGYVKNAMSMTYIKEFGQSERVFEKC